MNLLEKNTCKLRIKGSNQPIITDHTIPKVDRIELYAMETERSAIKDKIEREKCGMEGYQEMKKILLFWQFSSVTKSKSNTA